MSKFLAIVFLICLNGAYICTMYRLVYGDWPNLYQSLCFTPCYLASVFGFEAILNLLKKVLEEK